MNGCCTGLVESTNSTQQQPWLTVMPFFLSDVLTTKAVWNPTNKDMCHNEQAQYLFDSEEVMTVNFFHRRKITVNNCNQHHSQNNTIAPRPCINTIITLHNRLCKFPGLDDIEQPYR
jgi:hypothetical protein